ncbi:MAG: hypothetical protein AVDCRST_MAG68-4154 [uncultured Gemmatimonadetes bacterium]|uniref:Uncharacterized protein n=1 Tax=uncultured Gemmatimonadota bacterium TaxID=203437 RepID=A0A6J4MFY2_9BACT|nr:MAG: hypothetical protein AVDCRST_MAG68-4154 [uncultured Gemmatimonadota bacterium]
MIAISGHERRERLRAALRVLLGGLVFAAAVMCGTAGLYLAAGIPVAHLLKDPGALRPGPWYLGAVSYVGILLWCAAATVCLFTRGLLREPGHAELRRFLLGSALLSALLGLDDLFMLHDQVAPDYFGVSEKVIVLAYGAAALGYVVRFREMVERSPYFLLLVAGGFFALSVGVDAMDLDDGRILMVEDGAKLAGITAWLSYFAQCSADAIREGLAAVPRVEPQETAYSAQ